MKITDFITEASRLGLIQRPLTENEKDAVLTAMIKETLNKKESNEIKKESNSIQAT